MCAGWYPAAMVPGQIPASIHPMSAYPISRKIAAHCRCCSYHYGQQQICASGIDPVCRRRRRDLLVTDSGLNAEDEQKLKQNSIEILKVPQSPDNLLLKIFNHEMTNRHESFRACSCISLFKKNSVAYHPASPTSYGAFSFWESPAWLGTGVGVIFVDWQNGQRICFSSNSAHSSSVISRRGQSVRPNFSRHLLQV